jgi:hypothetical protein
MRLGLITIAAVLLGISPIARAQPSEQIALLPLDADQRLEIYGQPVAAEIARSLNDGKLLVVVVDAKMAVPEGVTLVVDGSITAKGAAVVLGVRVRNPITGDTTDKLEEPAANVAGIGKAATKLADRLLPVVKARLETLRKAPIDQPKRPKDPVRPQAVDPVVLLGIGVPTTASLMVEPFRQALIDNVNRTMRASHRQPSPVDASTLGKQLAVSTVATARATRGIAFEILDYDIEPGLIPLVRARVQVRIAEPSGVLFDRILVTDTIVGDKQITPEALAARTAREILTILRPHMKKLDPQWR